MCYDHNSIILNAFLHVNCNSPCSLLKQFFVFTPYILFTSNYQHTPVQITQSHMLKWPIAHDLSNRHYREVDNGVVNHTQFVNHVW